MAPRKKKSGRHGSMASPAGTRRLPSKLSIASIGYRKINGAGTTHCATDRFERTPPVPKPRTDRSFIVSRRRLSAELLDLTCLAISFLASGGRSALRPMFTSNTPVEQAARRLAKSGLIAYRRPRGQSPLLTITPDGHMRASERLWPERFWNRHWEGHWYVLMYDVPETDRAYRCALERFFRRERMGCLQKSVWISARDIRPLFDDLDQAAAIRDYAILLKASPVLGQSPKQISAQAWDFERLARQQTDYLDACAKRMSQATGALKPSIALEAARNELSEYLDLMQSDPLLPMELLPDNYAGPRVVAAFRSRLRVLVGRMFSI